MNNRLFSTILMCLLIGLISRFFPHTPNFTAVNALALFSFCMAGRLSYALFSVFTMMVLSDLILGFHSTIFYVYTSLGMIALLGYFTPSSLQRTWTLSLISSTLFFVVTNFGEWLNNALYAKNFLGLITCFLAATPFMFNQVLGDLFYSSMIFGLLKLINVANKPVSYQPIR